MAERSGWKALAARRTDGAEQRFVASGASIAVVDARGAFNDGLTAVRALADAVEANAGALLVLLSRSDVARIDLMFEAGATHYLAAPFGEAEFGQMLRFADRHAERLAGGYRAARGRAALIEAEAAAWRWLPGDRSLWLSPVLAARLGLSASAGPVRVVRAARRLDQAGRQAARTAIVRLIADGHPTGFAHALPADAEARFAHHIHLDADGAVIGRAEDLSSGVPPVRRSRDPLTGLEDGQGLRRWIGARMARADRSRASCALLLLGIGRFDTINAAYGKAAGDAVLRSVARRIERQLAGRGGRDRCVARIAGAEFAIALGAPVTSEEASLIATELIEAAARPFVIDHRMIALAPRIGIALAEGEEDAAALLRRASNALASARVREAGSIRLLDSDGEAAGARDLRLETDLRVALERDEIEIMFQPQVAVTDGRIVGVEALARWRHPELGELGAPTLFAAAERSDQLIPLSDHVQRKALAIGAGWPDTLAGLRMSVNVTAADIGQSDFAAVFLAMVDASGFGRGRVTVEITENGLIEDLAGAAALLADLRAGGLRVAIDDFGTGYSSLAYLKALPLDYLKIDQHFAQDITGSARDRIVVRGVIEMARSLGLAVIAEGVETSEQLSLLAAEGCNVYQGFLCAPPLDVHALTALLLGADEARGTVSPSR